MAPSETPPCVNLFYRDSSRGAIKGCVLIQLGCIAHELGAEHARAAADYVEHAYASGEITTVEQGEAILRANSARWKAS
jgi:hypothetical protein